MRIVKATLVLVFMLTIAGAGLYTGINRGWLKREMLDQLDMSRYRGQISSAQSQANILADRSQGVSSQAQQVLGTYIEINESDKNSSPQEKAFEYARYLYCQQVTEEWENTHP